jgi:xanthosine utilization system XapX-like protein
LIALLVLTAGAFFGSQIQQWLWTLLGRLPIR